MSWVTDIVETTGLPVGVVVTIVVVSFTLGRWITDETLDYLAKRIGMM